MLEQSTATVSTTEAREVARTAYLFGLPLVEHYRLFAGDFRPDSPMAHPANTFLHFDRLFTPKDRKVVSPNNDTLYSEANLDVRAEPVVFQTPDMGKRYYCTQLVDITTNNLPYIGTRATGPGAGTFVIARSDWTRQLPEQMKEVPVIRSPSRFVVALTRIGVDGQDDLAAAVALQRRFRVAPLSAFLGQDAPAAAAPVAWPSYFDTKTDTSLKFFEYMNFMMQWHQFAKEEAPLLARFAQLGIRPGARFDARALSPEVQVAMLQGVRDAREAVQHPPAPEHGWELPNPKVGAFGDDYELRARVAWNYLYANSPEEAVYPIAHHDGEGRVLDGSSTRYVLRFPKAALPPARFFWSLTMYDADNHMLVDNPLGRYSLGDRSRFLKQGEDGSLSIFLQHESPGPQRESQWLPAPEGRFYVLLRIYGPTRTDYVPPSIEALND